MSIFPTNAYLRKTIPADYLMQDTSRASELGVVILDACRDTPFVKQIAETVGPDAIGGVGRGLSKVSTVPRNTMLAYATQAGRTSRWTATPATAPTRRRSFAHLPTPREGIFACVARPPQGMTSWVTLTADRSRSSMALWAPRRSIYVPDSPFATANSAAASVPGAATPPHIEVASLAIPQIDQLGGAAC